MFDKKQHEKKYRDTHPIQRAVYQKKYKENHKEELSRKGKVYRDEDPERIKAQRRWSNYRITPEQFNALLVKQDGKCAICSMIFKQDGKKNEVAVVDHCHTTDKIRGLLCLTCNNGIGLLKDNPTTIRNAVVYIERNIKTVTEEIYGD